MALFPRNARTGQSYKKFGRKYIYSETTEAWEPIVSLASVSEARATAAASVGSTTVYALASELPLSNNTAGELAFVQETDRLYIWSGTGWYNIATITGAGASISGANSSYTLATDGTPTFVTLSQSGLTLPTWSYEVTTGSLGRTATVTQANNVFTITPSTGARDVGSFGLTFKATDGSNTIVTSSQFTMSNTAPVIDTGPSATYTLASDGTPTVIALAATDADGHSITWSYEVVSGSLEDTTITNVGEVFTLTPGNSSATFSIKFIASDSVLFDESTAASFILEFVAADQYYNQTTILLTTPGSETGTNYDIVDNGPNNIVPTVYPAIDDYPTVNADSPYSPTNFSTNGYSVAANASLLLGTQSFTFETWVYSPYVQFNSTFGNGYLAYSSYLRIRVLEGGVNKTGKIVVEHQQSGGTIFSTGNVLSTQTWHHIALTRDAATNIMTLYVDGVSVASRELPAHQRNFNTNSIGAAQMASLQMCDLRIVRGSVVYTSNFDRPTSPLTPISGTVLLTLSQNNSAKFFKDLSPYKNAVYPSSMTPMAPFASEVKYDPTIHGGSCVFSKKNGGPFIDMPSSATGPGTGDYTLEFWFRRHEEILGSNYSSFVHLTTGNGSHVAFYLHSGDYPSVSISSSSTITRTIQLPTIGGTQFRHAWYHVAIVRSSGTTNVYIDGELLGTSTAVYDLQGPVHTRLGRFHSGHSSNWSFGGQLSDVRFVRGTAVYTAPFEVPTSKLTAIPGTEYLFNFDNPKVITEQTTPISGRVAISDQVTKYSPTSMYFNGADGLYLASGHGAVATNFETGDFTMECWVYPTNNLTSTQMLFYGQSDTVQAGMRIASGSLQLFNGPNTVKASASLSGVSINQWIHCAIVRYNNTVKVYVNGVSGASVSDTDRYSRYSTSVGKISIGTYFGSTGDVDFSSRDQGHGFVGYMEDLRVTEGVARYTSNFTPPTAPLGWSNVE